MTLSRLIPVALAVVALGATLPAAAAADEKGEAKLAKVLDGRVPGEPVRCLDRTRRDNLEVIDRTAMVFKDGDTYYVNRPSGVNFLTWSDIPVFKIWGNELCKMDIVNLHDRSTGMGGASMTMNEFIPYRHAR